jgi:hypothetical protein
MFPVVGAMPAASHNLQHAEYLPTKAMINGPQYLHLVLKKLDNGSPCPGENIEVKSGIRYAEYFIYKTGRSDGFLCSRLEKGKENIAMSSNESTAVKNVSMVDKEAKTVPEDLSDLESDSASTRRPGSIYTIVGSVSTPILSERALLGLTCAIGSSKPFRRIPKQLSKFSSLTPSLNTNKNRHPAQMSSLTTFSAPKSTPPLSKPGYPTPSSSAQ